MAITKVQRVCALAVGGGAYSGSLCGLAASNSNLAFSNSNSNYGARQTHTWHCFKAVKENITPLKTSRHTACKDATGNIWARPSWPRASRRKAESPFAPIQESHPPEAIQP